MASELEVGKVNISSADGVLQMGSTAANGSPSLKLCEQTASGDISNGFSFNVDGDGTNNLHIKRHVVSASGTDAMVIDRDSGLCTFSGGVTVSGGLTSLGSFSEVTISGGGITVTSSTHRVDTQNDDATDQLSSISGGTDGSILVLQSVTSTRDVTVTHSNGTPAQNIRLAGGVSFTLDTSNDVLVLMKYGSNWREVSRSNNS
jgi:hypothetical protein